MATQPLLRPEPEPQGEVERAQSGGGGGAVPVPGGPRVPSLKIAIAILLAAETMFFTGLIGAFVLLRHGAPEWPPQGMPRLPLGVSLANTVVLLASAWTMRSSLRAARRDRVAETGNALALTAFLGTLFLLIQGSEWVRLVAHGLTLRSGVYGATFYTLIGVHGAHVLAAVAWLLVVLWRSRRGHYRAASHLGLEVCAMYWYFVVALWALLFVLVYLG